MDYWEEHACEEVFKSNCYCFAVNRYIGEFCQPGAATLSDPAQEPLVGTCEWDVKALVADGAVQVDRDTVYAKSPKGHYVALAVTPSDGDYHFWRFDNDGSWANKPGVLFPRRIYGSNNAKITDIEDAAVRGRYTEFCGYFEVFPETHKVAGIDSSMSLRLLTRFQAWGDAGLWTASTPLDRISRGWRMAYKDFWQPAGAATAELANGN